MAQRIVTHEPMSVAEYLQLEAHSDVRHEYVEGLLYAQAGASRNHGLIVSNLIAALRMAARGGPCRVYPGEVKLQVADAVIYYPDITVGCDASDTDPLVIRRPCLVVEVLSPSTAGIDRREKLMAYRRLPTLQGYLIVHQHERRVEWHWRDESATWRNADLRDEGVIQAPCVEVALSLADIYEEIEIEASPD